MSTFGVTPLELANAGTAVARGHGELAAAGPAVRATAGAAAGTPAAAACDALVDHATTMLTGLQTAVEDLSRALGKAAGNYQQAESTNQACLAPGAP